MSPLNITQPKSVYGLLDGYYMGHIWVIKCPIYPKWDSYQPMIWGWVKTYEITIEITIFWGIDIH